MSHGIPGGEAAPPRDAVGRTAGRRLVVALLVIPVAAVLAIPLYARVEPRVAGVPFFYWYQFGCLVLTIVCLATALVVSGRRPRRSRESTPW